METDKEDKKQEDEAEAVWAELHKVAEEVAKSRSPDTMKKLVLEAVKREKEMFAQPLSQKPTSTPTQGVSTATKAEGEGDHAM